MRGGNGFACILEGGGARVGMVGGKGGRGEVAEGLRHGGGLLQRKNNQ